MINIPESFLPEQANNGTKEAQYIKDILQDLWICLVSRECSLLGRREVLTGKAKFGIFGGGKELPQVVMARFFNKGDHRAGYYRDQTFAFAIGLSSVEDFFAQLYADADKDPFSGGRQMNSHYATDYIDAQDNWTNHANKYNVSSDISCTGGQMARALGLAHASKIYKNLSLPNEFQKFSNGGKEVTFCTIGDASTSEGIFWETMNAAAVTKVPLAVSIWDDGYGISVPIDMQTVKKSISKALSGFVLDENGDGIRIYTVNGWDYAALINAYDRAISRAREDHTPVLIHVKELTQPQGHSTSGSHERYKDQERLQWEKEYDCLVQFEKWIIDQKFISQEVLTEIKAEVKRFVKERKNIAWKSFVGNNPSFQKTVLDSIDSTLLPESIEIQKNHFKNIKSPSLSELVEHTHHIKLSLQANSLEVPQEVTDLLEHARIKSFEDYHTNLYSPITESNQDLEIKPIYSEEEKTVNGYQILNAYFEKIFATRPNVVAFGEDVGFIGDVNQGFAGIQNIYGKDRIFDTGIREWSIIGQAIGLSMRGFKPIAEIQYLDYIFYAISPLTDDLATLRYRSDGLQMAPAIIRSRGHRLEGIWHSGSHLGTLINCLRGMHVCVPRNMTQAVGMYNTLMDVNDPALVIEVLNGYRLKEKMPTNLLEMKVPLGVPEVLAEGKDITIVTYGACVKIASDALKILEEYDIYPELIDVQTLLPFDKNHIIGRSVAKTSRVLFLDEDVPGGASAYMMQNVIENQNAYFNLDAKPQTLTAYAHRPPFGSDGDYFSKPNAADVVEAVLNIIKE